MSTNKYLLRSYIYMFLITCVGQQNLSSKGPFTGSDSISISGNANYGYNAVLIGPFTVSISISINARKWVQHPFPVSASASTLLNPV